MICSVQSGSKVQAVGEMGVAGQVVNSGSKVHIVGLAGVGLKLLESVTHKPTPHFSNTNPLYNSWVSDIAFAALAYALYYFAKKPMPSEVVLEEVEAGE